MDLKQYTELKRQVDSLQQEVARAEGALNQLNSQLKEEFKVKDLITAKKLAKQLAEEIEEEEDNYFLSLKEWEKQWKEKLNGRKNETRS